jgi:hypothetical protein
MIAAKVFVVANINKISKYLPMTIFPGNGFGWKPILAEKIRLNACKSLACRGMIAT